MRNLHQARDGPRQITRNRPYGVPAARESQARLTPIVEEFIAVTVIDSSGRATCR